MMKFPGYFEDDSRTTRRARAAINRLAHNKHTPQIEAALENARDRQINALLHSIGAFDATQAYMRRARRERRDEPFYLEKLYRDAFRQAGADQQKTLQRIAFMQTAIDHFGIKPERANVYFHALPYLNAANADHMQRSRTVDFPVTMNSFFRAAPPRQKQAEAPELRVSTRDYGEPQRRNPTRANATQHLTA